MAKKYVNKSQHYSYNGMVSRTQLAVIDHNCNVGRLLSDIILLKKGEIEVPDLERPHLPQNIAPNPRGNKEDIIARHVSRFQ